MIFLHSKKYKLLFLKLFYWMKKSTAWRETAVATAGRIADRNIIIIIVNSNNIKFELILKKQSFFMFFLIPLFFNLQITFSEISTAISNVEINITYQFWILGNYFTNDLFAKQKTKNEKPKVNRYCIINNVFLYYYIWQNDIVNNYSQLYKTTNVTEEHPTILTLAKIAEVNMKFWMYFFDYQYQIINRSGERFVRLRWLNLTDSNYVNDLHY